MLDMKLDTLLSVVETKSFTGAASVLSLTQPAVSNHIQQLEKELGVKMFVRKKGELYLTYEGEIVVRCAKRLKNLYGQLLTELADAGNKITRLRVGITHTSESNIITEMLAKYGAQHGDVSITIVTDTIKNLYDKLANYELDMAVVEEKNVGRKFSYLMLDTDYLVCVLSNSHRLAKKSMVTLQELKNEQMILRLPTSATRQLFEATLTSMGESIRNFNVTLEVDNIATIKDLIRKELGISILPKSACQDELRKGKITVLPIENLSMLREVSFVYNRDFFHTEVLHELIKIYHQLDRS
ncbi:MAG: LysR family transcriptional regulator [Ruminococcaceae bacterium]|nr:LysR family transcriptional regulator [Oscillospiraceae bacterium]